jgi:hypothetical protein
MTGHYKGRYGSKTAVFSTMMMMLMMLMTIQHTNSLPTRQDVAPSRLPLQIKSLASATT